MNMYLDYLKYWPLNPRSSWGFFLVARRFELSNPDLIKDIHGIIKCHEVLSIGLKDEVSGFVN